MEAIEGRLTQPPPNLPRGVPRERNAIFLFWKAQESRTNLFALLFSPTLLRATFIPAQPNT